ncbi:MAG: ATP synthase F0 subunit C [Clostridia bacterium]|nr:ATP synthase F0 subunit C [Clostridia bacterium]
MRNSIIKLITLSVIVILTFSVLALPALAATDTTETEAVTEIVAPEDGKGDKAFAAAICIGLAATAGAIGMAWAITKAVEGISRQPEAEGKIRTTMMLGLVFVETAIIYALIVAILIIFVL